MPLQSWSRVCFFWSRYVCPESTHIQGSDLFKQSGLTAAGGLAQNYSISSDQFTSGLQTGLAMVQGEPTDGWSGCLSLTLAVHSEHRADSRTVSRCGRLSRVLDSEAVDPQRGAGPDQHHDILSVL